MDYLTHFFRTLIQIGLVAAAMGGIVVGTILLGLPPVLIPVGMVVLIGGYIYGSARWHAHWAPHAKRVAARRWTTDAGEEMETVIEKAIVQAGASTRSETLRVSIYVLSTGRRAARRLIGDDAEFLGFHGIGLWFHIADRFHARRDGLVCVDLHTGRWIYHQPKSEIPELTRTKTKGVYQIEDDEGTHHEINLNEQRANLPLPRRVR
ncbi:MAG: hypothetical protein AAGJ40_19455 [Planctomycetota bacterium]